tara:strand:+ start:1888 stop:2766 length:879 start_codon:yes stop_codon:yes gene_type:complete
MGLINQTQEQYYNLGNSSNYGNYQFVTLDNIINAFMYIYVGENKIISKINRSDVQFHAMRAVQELSYDVFRSIKSQEIEVPNTLTMILPQDYVNYVKVSVIGNDGIKRNLYPTGKTSNPFAIAQSDDGTYTFDGDQNLIEKVPSSSWENYQGEPTNNSPNTTDSTEVELSNFGRRYGLDPQHSHEHGSFYIDHQRGLIHFSSTLSSKIVVLDYISDGLGTDSEMVVHKFCEEAVYKWIAYGVLSTRSNMPEYLIQRFKREKFAETRKAKIRLSNIKMEEFTQILKGVSKQIK